MVKPKKKKTPWNLKTKLTAAIRKIWRTSPLKQLALELACVDPTKPVRERTYRCSCCGGAFLAQLIDVDHRKAAEKNELINTMVNRLFCGIEKVAWDEDTPITWYASHEVTLEEVVKSHLDCLCLDCHKAKTKKEAKERKSK